MLTVALAWRWDHAMQTTLPFLHDRIRDPAIIKSYVQRPGELETNQLDFKGEIGKHRNGTVKLTELATDIAALANSLGGELILGLAEVNERAAGLNPIPAAALKTNRQWIAQALERLRPGDFVTSVRPDPVEIDPGQHVIAISVPPSPDIVAVRDQDDSRLSFPVRVDCHTEYLPYEEIMLRSRATARTMRLRLFDLYEQLNRTAHVKLCSSLGAAAGTGFAISGARQERDGMVMLLEGDTLRLSMVGYPNGFHYTIPHSGAPTHTAAIPADRPLQIPYELMRAAWIEESGGHMYLCLALDRATVVWNGGDWGIVAD
jgi:hypothetical protein